MSGHVVVVGGGLAGLAASLILARGGRTVTLFEKRQALGGRAATHVRQGYRFNLGAHSLFRRGAAARVLRELGIPVGRKAARHKRKIALFGGQAYRLPSTFWSLISSGLLAGSGKAEALVLATRLWRLDYGTLGNESTSQWLTSSIMNAHLRHLVAALIREACYAADLDRLPIAVALPQLSLAMRGRIYVDEGWQRLVDGLHSAAVAAGVTFVTSSRVVRVVHDGAVQGVELGGLEVDASRSDTRSIAMPDLTSPDATGARIPAGQVILAVDPETAGDMIDDAALAKSWSSAQPGSVACLDIALSRLPLPRRTFGLDIDRALVATVHSTLSQLAPRGGAVIHTVKYGAAPGDLEQLDPVRSASESPAERELQGLLDFLQPGWRDVLIHRRFFPALTASNDLYTVPSQRPSAITPVRGLFIAGDWVGGEGLLADAALASARAAATACLGT